MRVRVGLCMSSGTRHLTALTYANVSAIELKCTGGNVFREPDIVHLSQLCFEELQDKCTDVLAS